MRVTIEKLVYGGAGLARTEQGVVFVPRTAPGDVVEVEPVERKTDYAVARVTALLEPSPDRQTAHMPNYESAGCCHWQHIRYSASSRSRKRSFVKRFSEPGVSHGRLPIARVSGLDTALPPARFIPCSQSEAGIRGRAKPQSGSDLRVQRSFAGIERLHTQSQRDARRARNGGRSRSPR